jgi:hypothetical protein
MDYLHNGKKLLNCAHHASRTLEMGPGMFAHLNSIDTVTRAFEPLIHGLNKGDASRDGYNSMDWPSLCRLISLKTLGCMLRLKIGDGVPANTTVSGTLEYLKLIRRYVSIFTSHVASMSIRVESAAYVVTLLRLWRQWVRNTNGKLLSRDFITREAFTDVVLSCHAFVLMVMCQRDLAPMYPATPWKMGSNVVEDLFALCGGFVMHKRVYSILDACHTISTRYKAMMATATSGVEAAWYNRRLREQWDEDPNAGEQAADLTQWLSNDELEQQWSKGEKNARITAAALGMKPRAVLGRLPERYQTRAN